MIDHAFKPHEVWTTRDQCEHRLDEEKDGAYGICAAPRSEHMDEVHVLKVQLATALKERDEARAERDAWRRTADIRGSLLGGDDASFRKEIAEAQAECDGLRAALNEIVGATDDDVAEKIARTALAAPGDGEEGKR